MALSTAARHQLGLALKNQLLGNEVCDAVDSPTTVSATITTLTATTGNITTVNATDIDAGASGTAGTVDIFPTTASKGKTQFTAAANSGNTTTTITTAAQASTRTYTIPDAGASTASFVMTAGTNATCTITTLTSTDIDAGASGTAGTVDIFPTTASKGKLQITCTDQTGNTTVSLVAGAMATARTITIPDPGGNDSVVFLAATQTLTNKTITANICADTVFCTTQFDAVTGTTGTTLTNVVGMSTTVVPGTYLFRINLPGTSTANSGIKGAFKYTTTVLTSLESTAQSFTAAAVAVTHTTTATDQALLFDNAAAAISTVITGRMVVSTGGTVAFQAAQHAAHADTTSVYVGASMTFTRVA